MTKIMLVEDEASMLELLSMYLELEGFQVAKMEQGQNILEQIQTHKPDLVFMDVHLKDAQGQEISGIDILKHIRQDEVTSGIKVLMASGMDMGHECLQAGANGFLLKPFMPDELIAKIKNL